MVAEAAGLVAAGASRDKELAVQVQASLSAIPSMVSTGMEKATAAAADEMGNRAASAANEWVMTLARAQNLGGCESSNRVYGRSAEELRMLFSSGYHTFQREVA